MDFMKFRNAVNAQIKRMVDSGAVLLVTDVNPYDLQERYQVAFPEGTNPIFRERAEHDCNCCNSFIRKVGNVVALVDGQLESIWSNVNCGEEAYDIVAKAMADFVLSKDISNILRLKETHVAGTDFNFDNETDRKWNHFFYEMPKEYLVEGTNHPLNLVQNHHIALKNSLDVELSALELVIDLAENNSIYRGEEKLPLLNQWKELLAEDFHPARVWELAYSLGQHANFRGSAIGTLVDAISKGEELDHAVNKYETMVAPQNYKRSSKVVTKGMIQEAQKKVVALGVQDALARRHARISDLTINNALFANRNTKKQMNVFDTLMAQTVVQKPNHRLVPIDIKDFLVVAVEATSMELYLENKYENNLFTLIAPEDPEAGSILKWNNNFSWTYNNDVTDSIRDRVIKAGGGVDGMLRVSLAWHNRDDLDLHVRTMGEHISYSNKRGHVTGGVLDVDMNYGANHNPIDPVENIVWAKDEQRVFNRNFEVSVRNMSHLCSDTDFTVEVEYQNQTHHFTYPKHLSRGTTVFNFKVDAKGITFSNVNPEVTTSVQAKEMWGVKTQTFVPVSLFCLSPNYWDDNAVGNKHYMFALENCKNPDSVRGFYNEFLSPELHSSRKVFEVLGNQMKAPYADEQVSGVAFSSTQRNTAVIRVVKGSEQIDYEVSF